MGFQHSGNAYWIQIEFNGMNTELIFIIVFACFGSFLNVVIHRYYSKESVIFGSSHCPKCKYKIKWFDNIPIASWLFLQGRCRACKKPISFIYPIVEILCAFIGYSLFFSADHFFISGYKHDWSLSIALLSFFVFCGFLVITFIDLKSKIIPHRFLIFSGLNVFFIHFLTGNKSDSFMDGLIGMFILAVSLAGVLWIGSLMLKRDAMGWGDVKMALVIGFLLGLNFGYVAIFTAIFTGAVFGLLMMASKKMKNQNYRNLEMPFGPFLALGTYLTFLYGPKLINDFFSILS